MSAEKTRCPDCTCERGGADCKWLLPPLEYADYIADLTAAQAERDAALAENKDLRAEVARLRAEVRDLALTAIAEFDGRHFLD